MNALCRETELIAQSNLNVLIMGETGVGKDVLAQSIHDRSPRSRKPFLRLNCAALTEPLLESELFGHQRGAFTGAMTSKVGLLQTANGGSVLLDELGELPLRLQAKLLHVLETKVCFAIGSLAPTTLDVRFLAATNRELAAEVRAGNFRSDLYYRIAGYIAKIPPLRERREDVLPLARAFLRHAQAEASPLSEEVEACLLAYSWPGNVRELRNVIERAVVLSGRKPLAPQHLSLSNSCEFMPSRLLESAPQHMSGPSTLALSPLEQAQRQSIVEALAETGGNQIRAARLLGVSRSTLLNRLDAYRLRRPRKRPC
ncbi:MAG TPA: sigma-54 dependent transcriptional regulator [Polyangiaceae bacterium]|nr:sigma-54 dependent transcriptional regulator [Polyangiaceae bacterium]